MGSNGPSIAVPKPVRTKAKCINVADGVWRWSIRVGVVSVSTLRAPKLLEKLGVAPIIIVNVTHQRIPLRILLVSLCWFTVLGCRNATSPTTATSSTKPIMRFPVRGKVVAVQGSSVTLDHEAVPGFMGAMTMPYKLKDPAVASELHPGDRVTATILVHKDADGFTDPILDEIVVIAQARPDYKPVVQYHTPTPGDNVPDFALLNQSDRTVHLHDFRGKFVLATFIYTRCTIADYCPRMSRNFASIDEALAKDPALYNKTHLLSISFDPAYDTPQVLRNYGGSYTGRFNAETFKHWDFAAPPQAELPAIAHFFGVGITPGEAGSLSHSLSTVLIDPKGKVLVWYPTYEWTPDQMLAELNKAVAA